MGKTKESDKIDLADLKVVPDQVQFAPQTDKTILLTHFTDAKHYHAPLVKKILELESSARASQKIIPGSCGTKIYDVHTWNCPEANFLNERVFKVVSEFFNAENLVVDLSWASVYRRKDYCMPHAHVRAKASVVYFLDVGDPIDRDKDPFGGRFCIMDPRIEFCLQEQAGFCDTAVVPGCQGRISYHLSSGNHSSGSTLLG